MKILFFQPYVAAWRYQFLDQFSREFQGIFHVVAVDGGHRSIKELGPRLSQSGHCEIQRLRSSSVSVTIRGQSYPIYFSPGLFWLLFRTSPDVVVTEGEINLFNNIQIFIYCKCRKKRYVWWSLGKVRSRKKSFLNRIFDPINRLLISNASAIMARNSLASTYYKSMGAIPESRIFLVPNSMDEGLAREDIGFFGTPRVERLPDAKVVLYVGALTPEKRPLDVVRLADLLINRFGRKDVHFWIVGSGSEADLLEAAVRLKCIHGNVHFFGSVFSGIGRFFELADVVYLPGLGGLVINHAMIFGCPVVARLADGTELDLIENGKTGYILRGEAIDDAAEAIVRIIDAPDREMIRDYCRKVVEERWNMKLMTKAAFLAVTNKT